MPIFLVGGADGLLPAAPSVTEVSSMIPRLAGAYGLLPAAPAMAEESILICLLGGACGLVPAVTWVAVFASILDF